MKLIVNPHKIEIVKNPVNEKEINITKCQFEFANEITADYVKKAYFTYKGTTYEVLIENDECNIPQEVLKEVGQVEIGVVATLIENEQYVKRYNPSPAYFDSWIGSLKENIKNTEPITPTDKEQIEQRLNQVEDEMDNLDVDAEKVEHTTTITITKKDGTEKTVEILDGEKGDKGDKGDPGAIKFMVVQTLPTQDIQEDTIYLIPLETPDAQGNNYAEYIRVNNDWELLGKIAVQVDLTDYATKEYVNELVGDIDNVLDAINGEIV